MDHCNGFAVNTQRTPTSPEHVATKFRYRSDAATAWQQASSAMHGMSSSNGYRSRNGSAYENACTSPAARDVFRMRSRSRSPSYLKQNSSFIGASSSYNNCNGHSDVQLRGRAVYVQVNSSERSGRSVSTPAANIQSTISSDQSVIRTTVRVVMPSVNEVQRDISSRNMRNGMKTDSQTSAAVISPRRDDVPQKMFVNRVTLNLFTPMTLRASPRQNSTAPTQVKSSTSNGDHKPLAATGQSRVSFQRFNRQASNDSTGSGVRDCRTNADSSVANGKPDEPRSPRGCTSPAVSPSIFRTGFCLSPSAIKVGDSAGGDSRTLSTVKVEGSVVMNGVKPEQTGTTSELQESQTTNCKVTVPTQNDGIHNLADFRTVKVGFGVALFWQ